MPDKHSNTERFGGPGASHEDAAQHKENPRGKVAGGRDKTMCGTKNPHHSYISGGGGELDIHHTHDPEHKR